MKNMISTEEQIPLVVDLDNTLLEIDCFHEYIVLFVKKYPFSIWKLPFWLLKGKAHLKAKVFEVPLSHIEDCPVNADVAQFCSNAHDRGVTVILITGTAELIASKIKNKFPWISQVIGSSSKTNMVGSKKLAALDSQDITCFDFISDHKRDLPVFQKARKAYIVGKPAPWASHLTNIVFYFSFNKKNSLRSIFKLIRPYQWVKNSLILVPLILAHRFSEPHTAHIVALSILAFSAIASSVYISNDLLDFENDRHHPSKKNRPIPAGLISIPFALGLGILFFAIGIGIGGCVSKKLTVILLVYVLLNSAYSTFFKKIPIVDIFVLSSFYIIRLFTGGLVPGIEISNWLLVYSLPVFKDEVQYEGLKNPIQAIGN